MKESIKIENNNIYATAYELINYEEEGYYFVIDCDQELTPQILENSKEFCELLFSHEHILLEIKGTFFAFECSTYVKEIATIYDRKNKILFCL